MLLIKIVGTFGVYLPLRRKLLQEETLDQLQTSPLWDKHHLGSKI